MVTLTSLLVFLLNFVMKICVAQPDGFEHQNENLKETEVINSTKIFLMSMYLQNYSI